MRCLRAHHTAFLNPYPCNTDMINADFRYFWSDWSRTAGSGPQIAEPNRNRNSLPARVDNECTAKHAIAHRDHNWLEEKAAGGQSLHCRTILTYRPAQAFVGLRSGLGDLGLTSRRDVGPKKCTLTRDTAHIPEHDSTVQSPQPVTLQQRSLIRANRAIQSNWRGQPVQSTFLESEEDRSTEDQISDRETLSRLIWDLTENRYVSDGVFAFLASDQVKFETEITDFPSTGRQSVEAARIQKISPFVVNLRP